MEMAMSYMKRVVPVLLVLAAIAGLAACGGGDDSTSAGASADGAKATSGGESAATIIVVKNGEPVGGVQELEYSAGEQVRFTVGSDVADEVHVHGYDLMKDVAAGGTVSFSFPADIEGIFEVELEGRKEQIAELRVNP
jgi:plastocyanin